MTQPLSELVEQFCHFQRKQRGKSDRGVKTYRWVLEQFLVFVKTQRGRMARVHDVSAETIQAWMDDMAAADLALETMRMRQSAVSSFCAWLVKRQVLPANPVARLDRPPHRREAPKQVPGPAIMDALVQAARQRGRPRDTALFLILRYTGMRRESVATLQVRHLDLAAHECREILVRTLVNSRVVGLLDHPQLLRELRGLERRPGAAGRDRVDHRPGAHDDLANSAAGALVLAALQLAHPEAPPNVWTREEYSNLRLALPGLNLLSWAEQQQYDLGNVVIDHEARFEHDDMRWRRFDGHRWNYLW